MDKFVFDPNETYGQYVNIDGEVTEDFIKDAKAMFYEQGLSKIPAQYQDKIEWIIHQPDYKPGGGMGPGSVAWKYRP